MVLCLLGTMKTSTYQLLSGCKVLRIVDLDTATEVWPFILRGLDDLNDPHKGRAGWSPEMLLYHFLSCITSGVAFLLQSKNGKPLGYIFGKENSSFKEKGIEILASYSSGKYLKTREELFAFLESWARNNGYSFLLATSNRVNGSAFRWYEDKCKFKRVRLVFKKAL